MSAERSGDGFDFVCDFCNRRPEHYAGDFGKAWAAAKGDGWRASRDPTGAWVHRCPSCARDLVAR